MENDNQEDDPDLAKILGLNYKLAILETGIDSLTHKFGRANTALEALIEKIDKKLMENKDGQKQD